MTTPICDFVRAYAGKNMLRMHMPGHKGRLPGTALDITEIAGADSLYEADGIIAQSEENAAGLLGSRRTFYSCEGSSLAIRAMVSLAAGASGRFILAGRNAHRAFLAAAALLDLRVGWLPCTGDGYLGGKVSPETLEAALQSAPEKPCAVYITSPDYLGGLADVRALAQTAHRYGVPLLVDNAHGAYLRFLDDDRHPMALGADACCDSAHKTLPVLTGGAYLHIGNAAPAAWDERARDAMVLFGSTSPSYLILQSLDAANARLAGTWRDELRRCCRQLQALRDRLTACGYVLCGDEPMKLTIHAKAAGRTGTELADLLREHGIEPEFADPDWLVLMPSPETTADELTQLADALCAIPLKAPITEAPPALPCCPQARSIRDAMLAPREVIPVEEAAGRILAAAAVSCPPAVPIAVCGEQLNAQAIRCFRYYGIEKVPVVCE